MLRAHHFPSALAALLGWMLLCGSPAATAKQTAVPFFMYSPSLFRGYNEVDFSIIHQRKHNHAIYAIRAASRHPWRLNNIHDARIKVAFIPVLVDYVARSKATKNTAPTDSGGILEQMAQVVRNSSLYPRVRHVLIANDWISQNYFTEINNLFPQGNVVLARMENMMSEYRHVVYDENGQVVSKSGQRQPYPCSFGLGYTSSYTAYQPADFKMEVKSTSKDELISRGSSDDGAVQPFVKDPAPPGPGRTISVAFTGAVGYAMHGRKYKKNGYVHRVRLFEAGRCLDCTSGGCGTCGAELPNAFIAAMETEATLQGYRSVQKKGWWNVTSIPACPEGNGYGNDDSYIGFNRCAGPVPLRAAQRARELANFSLALRGDTLGSDRWINAMVAGAIPVHVGTEEELGWLPFQSIVPWKDFIVTIPEEQFMKDPVKVLESQLLAMPDSELARRRKLMRHHVKDIDWGSHHSRTFNNFLAETLLVDPRFCSTTSKGANTPFATLQSPGKAETEFKPY